MITPPFNVVKSYAFEVEAYIKLRCFDGVDGVDGVDGCCRCFSNIKGTPELLKVVEIF
jgi:hypothetical protein